MPDGQHCVVGMDRLGTMKIYDMNAPLNGAHGVWTNGFRVTSDGISGRGGLGKPVTDVAVTCDGQHLVAGASKVVKVWGDLDVPQGKVVACKGRAGMTGHQDEVRAIAVTPDGKRILSGARDHTVRVWLFSGRLENIFSELHTSTVDALVALPDNDHALSGAQTGTIKLFNINDGAVLRTFSMAAGHDVLALLPDGRRFVGGHFGPSHLRPRAGSRRRRRRANLAAAAAAADGTTVRVRLLSGTFDRKFAPEATLHTVLCAIHHESGTKLLAGKKYHFIEPGPQ